MSDYVMKVMEKHSKWILDGFSVCVPDDAEEMNWRLFFAHSQDMQGFRADIFTGGKDEADNPHDPAYNGLRDLWEDSRSMIDALATLWENPETRHSLQRYSNPFRSDEEKRNGIRPCMEILRGAYGNPATRVFADALDTLRGGRIARRTNRMIRAYVQNAAILRPHGLCFRNYLLNIHPLPMPNANDAEIEHAENAWIMALRHDFYNVEHALANYLICDWLLSFWRIGSIRWFKSYKEDSVFFRTLGNDNKLPLEAVQDFPRYCQSLTMQPDWVPSRYPNIIGAPIPPRLLNAAIWLEENKSS